MSRQVSVLSYLKSYSMALKEKPGRETRDAWHDDPANWKLGIFYFNRKDKRLFPPKRLQGMGWTVNFANPFSLLALLALIAAIILFARFIKSLS